MEASASHHPLLADEGALVGEIRDSVCSTSSDLEAIMKAKGDAILTAKDVKNILCAVSTARQKGLLSKEEKCGSVHKCIAEVGNVLKTVVLGEPPKQLPPVQRLKHDENSSGVAWSPNGIWLATSSCSGFVYVRTFRYHELFRHDCGSPVQCISWSPVQCISWDSKKYQLAACTKDGHLCIFWWYVNKQTKVINKFWWKEGLGTTLESVAWSRDNMLAVGSPEDVRIFNVTEMSQLERAGVALDVAQGCNSSGRPVFKGAAAARIQGPAFTLAWSSDGSQLAIGDISVVRIFVNMGHWSIIGSGGLERNASMGPWRQIVTLKHAGEVMDLSWSLDGSRLATCAEREACVFLVGTWEEELKLQHEAEVWCVSWNSTGSMLATGTLDGYAQIFEVGSKAEICKFQFSESCDDGNKGVWQVAWNPDGNLFAIGGCEHHVDIHRVEFGSEFHQQDLETAVRGLAWSRTGDQLATVSDRLHVYKFDKDTLTPSYQVAHKDSSQTVYAYFVVDNLKFNDIIADDRASQTFKVFLKEKFVAIAGMQHDHVSVDVAANAREMDVKRVDAESVPDSVLVKFTLTVDESASSKFKVGERVKAEHPRFGQPIYAATILKLNSDDTPCQIRWDRWRVEDEGDESESFVEADPRNLQKGSIKEAVKHVSSWLIDNIEEVDALKNFAANDLTISSLRVEKEGDIRSMAWSSDGCPQLAIGFDGYICIYNMDTTILNLKDGERIDGQGCVHSVAWRRHGQHQLATGSGDMYVRVFKRAVADGWEEIFHNKHESPVLSVSWSPKCSSLATGSEGSVWCVFNVDTGEHIFRAMNGNWGVYCLEWRPDGSELVFGDGGGGVNLVLTDTWNQIPVERPQERSPAKAVRCLAWSPDGSQLAVGSYDDYVRVFNMGTRKLFFKLKHTKVNCVAWSPDGSTLATGADDSHIRTFNVRMDMVRSLLLSARSTADRTLAAVHKNEPCPSRVDRIHDWLAASPAHMVMYILLYYLKKETGKVKQFINPVKLILQHLFEQSDGVEVALSRDLLGLNVFDLALHIEDEDTKVAILSTMLNPNLLAWIKDNSVSVLSSGLAKVLEGSLCYLMRTERASSLNQAASLVHFLDAARVRLDHQNVGFFPELLQHPPSVPTTAGASLELLAITRDLPYIKDYNDDEFSLPKENAVPLLAEIVLLPGIAADEVFLSSLACKWQPDEYNLFACTTVRAIVQMYWDEWRPLFYIYIFLHSVMLLGFSAYTCIAGSPTISVIAKISLTIAAIVLFGLEVSEFIGKRLRYQQDFGSARQRELLDKWTVLGLLIPALAVGCTWYEGAFAVRPPTAWLLWMYSFHYLEAFEGTSFYIRMVSQTFVDMYPFLSIFAIVLCGFAQAFHLASAHMLPEDDIMSAWQRTFRLGVYGDIDDIVDMEKDGYLYFLFFLNTVCVPVILLNILIAIISDTYDAVRDRRAASFTKSRAQLVYELQGAFWWTRFRPSFNRLTYLMVFTKDQGEGVASDWQGRVNEVKLSVKDGITPVDKKIDRVEMKMNSVEAKMAAGGRIAELNTSFKEEFARVERRMASVDGIEKRMSNLEDTVKSMNKNLDILLTRIPNPEPAASASAPSRKSRSQRSTS